MEEAAYLVNARKWMTSAFDEATRKEVEQVFNTDKKELEDRFYRNLEFGTGGLRGVMGAGTNRMNKYTVGMATQGLANYVVKNFGEGVSVAISYDSRNNSRYFADITAGVLMSNGLKVYLFDDIRPTPELSFTIRHLGCKAGVMITASHNPKEYNGYKVFWEDGSQVTTPHDKNIIDEVNKIEDPSQVKFAAEDAPKPVMIGKDVDEAFFKAVLSLMVTPDAVARHKDIKIVYTPLHGTGIKTVPVVINRMGFENLYIVKEQAVCDGNFPTVVSPNPEEPTAMKMAMDLAGEVGADIVLGTDPDADRIGLAVRDDKGEIKLLTGNQIVEILTKYLLQRWQELGKLTGNEYMVTTIVTTEMLTAICEDYGVDLYRVLTGFKNIAEIVRNNEGKRTFIGGGEESNGYNAGEFVRDKDSAVSCGLVCECAAWLADRGQTLYGFLQEIYAQYGLYTEKLISVVRKGKEGLEQIRQMMVDFREKPVKELAGSPVVKVIDYLDTEKTGLAKSNVLQFFSADGSKVSVRPSGTEPKIKFYFGVKGDNPDAKLDALVNQFSV
ncbi:MAG: phospho-sugar mutase [Bacteroidales bacterium]|nr:phospho-sugar mutase [Bacteroidales bacterium]